MLRQGLVEPREGIGYCCCCGEKTRLGIKKPGRPKPGRARFRCEWHVYWAMPSTMNEREFVDFNQSAPHGSNKPRHIAKPSKIATQRAPIVIITRKVDDEIRGDFDTKRIATCAALNSVRDRNAAEIKRTRDIQPDF
jgi:hypothetical protein